MITVASLELLRSQSVARERHGYGGFQEIVEQGAAGFFRHKPAPTTSPDDIILRRYPKFCESPILCQQR